MKPFLGGKDDNFLIRRNGILEVTGFMGEFTEVSTGDVLVNLLRATIRAMIQGFGTIDLGQVEKGLQNIFALREERYDKLFSWRYDESKSFY